MKLDECGSYVVFRSSDNMGSMFAFNTFNDHNDIKFLELKFRKKLQKSG